MENETIITIFAALAAALSVLAFALPLLKRSEKKEKYKSIIEKRRKDLFQATREAQNTRIVKDESVSARDNMAMLFRFQKLAGTMGEKARDKMLQAGIRNPKAHLKFMVSRIVVPIVFVALAVLYLKALPEGKEYSGSMELLIVAGVGFFGFKLPDILVKNMIIKRQQEFSLSFPDSLDMMLICVQGGIGLEQTVERVAKEVAEQSPVLAEELG